MRGIVLLAVVAALLSVIAACGRAAEARAVPPPAADAESAFAQARADGRPVVLVVRDESDVGALDAGVWLEDPALADELARVHVARLWAWDEAKPADARVGVSAFAP